LGNDRSTEYPGEGIVYRRLEFALDPRDQPPLATHVLPFVCTCHEVLPADGKRITPVLDHSRMVSGHRVAAALSKL
jgi:hypothetical protein